MDDFFVNVLANIVADIGAFLLLGGVPLLILSSRYIIGKRRRLLAFLGIEEDHSDFTVYLSTLFVKRFGSLDFRGTPRSYRGPAIPFYEMAVASIINSLFDAPLLDELPNRMRDWLSSKYWPLKNIRPVLKPSPDDKQKVRPGNVLAVGSPAYNSAAALYTETCDPFLKFEELENGPTVIRVVKGLRKGDVLDDTRKAGDDTAIVERLYDKATKSTIFIAAGHGVHGTAGAVHYIVDNWEKLYRDFGTRPFAMCLLFRSLTTDPNAVQKPVELGRFAT